LGLLDRMRDDPDRAERHMREALALAREVGDQRLIVRGLIGLGMIASDRSNIAVEDALLDEALSIARANGDRHGEAVVLQNLCTNRWAEGNIATAVALNEEALARFREIDDPFSVGIGLINGGMLAAGVGDTQQAAAHYAEALATYRALGDPSYVSATLVRIAELARTQGDLARAATAYREAIELERDSGTDFENVDTLLMLMRLAAMRNETELGARLVGAAEAHGDWRTRRSSISSVAGHEAAIAGLRVSLGSAAYDAAWAEGRAMSLDQIIAAVRRLEVDPTAVAQRAAERLGLSPREVEVVQLLSEGLTDRQIADRLFIARKTASNHVAAILEKLGLEKRSAVGAFALRNGLVSPAASIAIGPAPRA
jgi:DNA-binding CsgD family transcriptional regulator